MSELSRVLEPEVMDTDDEARDYDAMDHREVNARFVDDLLALSPDLSRTLDVGTGTALIPISLAKKAPKARIVAIDLAEAMLARAKENVAREGVADRIELRKGDGKRIDASDGAFTCVMSNSIVHHVPEPEGALGEMARVTAKGGLLFVRDLVRPANERALRDLVACVCAKDTPAQRKLFEDSLRAALTLDETRAIARAIGIADDAVAITSDRHWTLAWRRP